MQMNINITKQELHEAIAEFYGITAEQISSVNVVEETSAQNPTNGLWYPDDGNWIETNGSTPNISDALYVFTLGRSERGYKRWTDDCAKQRSRWAWSNIVAYKLA